MSRPVTSCENEVSEHLARNVNVHHVQLELEGILSLECNPSTVVNDSSYWFRSWTCCTEVWLWSNACWFVFFVNIEAMEKKFPKLVQSNAGSKQIFAFYICSEMVFSSPKCISFMSDGVIATGFKRSLKCSLLLPTISSSLLRKTPSFSLMFQAIGVFFAAEMADGLSVIGIENLPRLYFGRFHRECCGLSRLNMPPMQRIFGFVLKPCLEGYFLCADSIFHFLGPPQCSFFTIIRHTGVVSVHIPEQQTKLELLLYPRVCCPVQELL